MNFKFETDEDGDIELHIDGKFEASWKHTPSTNDKGDYILPGWVVIRMLEHAFEAGQAARSEEIRKLLRV